MPTVKNKGIQGYIYTSHAKANPKFSKQKTVEIAEERTISEKKQKQPLQMMQTTWANSYQKIIICARAIVACANMIKKPITIDTYFDQPRGSRIDESLIDHLCHSVTEEGKRLFQAAIICSISVNEQTPKTAESTSF